MPAKGLVMICLAGISCVAESGCLQSAALPPASAISDGATRQVMPRNPIVNTVPTDSPLATEFRARPYNPWKPTVPERDWKYLVLHHTATDAGTVESIHRAHLKKTDKSGNHWLGIGYHFVIGNGNGMGDGEIQPTFRWDEQIHGAHAGVNKYNQHGIGIVLVGNFEERPPTPAQLEAVKQLVGTLKAQYQLSDEDVVGHGDVKSTACPGRYFPIEEISRAVFAPSILQRAGEPSIVSMANQAESPQQ